MIGYFLVMNSKRCISKFLEMERINDIVTWSQRCCYDVFRGLLCWHGRQEKKGSACLNGCPYLFLPTKVIL